LFFIETESSEIPYDKRKGSKYLNEEGATGSLISKDFNNNF